MGDTLNNLKIACKEISNHAGMVELSSKIYFSEAWGNESQDDFLNQALKIETRLNPFETLHAILEIEKMMGRVRNEKWEPRLIDIDILLFGEEKIETEILQIPHPFLQDRRFALVPLNEIASTFVHPVFEMTISELLDICTDSKNVLEFNK